MSDTPGGPGTGQGADDNNPFKGTPFEQIFSQMGGFGAGGGMLEIAAPAHEVSRFRDVPHTEAGMRHLTLAYDNVVGMIETLEAAGVEIVEQPRRAYNTEMISRVAFVRDPDGILVELIERAPGR